MANESKIWLLVLLIVGLSFLDIFSNALSFIPIVGGLFETISETILEITQIIMTIILAMIAGKK